MTKNKNRAQFDRYRAWQWIKHLAFADYVRPWAAKVGSTAMNIHIVDLFAGAATYTDVRTGVRADGSPVIFALESARYAEMRPGKTLQVICVERNDKNHEALEKRVGGFDHVTTLKGGFEHHVDRILANISDDPALLIFDPIGLKPIPAETILPLLHRKGKTDVFMILHFKGLHRMAGWLLPTGYARPEIEGAEAGARSFDAVFGTHRWRQIAKNPRLRTVEQREQAYLALYAETVLGDRFEWQCAYAVRAKTFAKVQYWLYHASDHLDAHLLMNDEIVKLETSLHARTYEDGTLDGMIEHENHARISAAETRLRDRILETVSDSPGETKTFGVIHRELLSEFFGQVKQGAYSRAVKGLVGDGRLIREDRLAAKLDIDEWISVPVEPSAGVAPAA